MNKASHHKPLLAVSDALAKVIAATPVMPSEPLPITDCLDRFLAEDVYAILSHPPHNASAMDGYACRSDDLDILPARLKIIGESAAGNAFTQPINPGECVRIFTGAACPSGANIIAIQEDCIQDEDEVIINAAPPKGRFIRRLGQDFMQGAPIAQKGDRINARRLALLAAAGHSTIKTYRKPRIAILSTGDELKEVGSTPGPGQIVSSNDIFLNAMVKKLGGEPISLGIVPDCETTLKKILAKAHNADLIVTSGGASVGKHDHIARLMTNTDNNAQLEFWRIAMRPGKPLIFGKINDIPILGLPGNPVSVAVCAIVFLQSLCKKMLGQNPDPDLPTKTAILTKNLPPNDARQDFLRATLSENDVGQQCATPFDVQDSSMLKTLSDAHILIIRAPHAPAIKNGEQVQYLDFPEGI